MTFEMMVAENEASVLTSLLRPRLLTCYAKCFPSGGETLRLRRALQVASRSLIISQTVSPAFSDSVVCIDVKILSKPVVGCVS